jgi:hypothetical protein
MSKLKYRAARDAARLEAARAAQLALIEANFQDRLSLHRRNRKHEQEVFRAWLYPEAQGWEPIRNPAEFRSSKHSPELGFREWIDHCYVGYPVPEILYRALSPQGSAKEERQGMGSLDTDYVEWYRRSALEAGRPRPGGFFGKWTCPRVPRVCPPPGRFG